MSWRDIVKSKKLTDKQKKLDNNHNGVIDAQDFHIMNGAEKKSCGPNCNCSSCGETEKLSFGTKQRCSICGSSFPNMKALDSHMQQRHSGSQTNSAFTARD